MTESRINKDGLLEPLRVALTLEREGKRLFSEAAGSTTSKLARQTFEFLASEEDKHIEKIEKFYEALASSSEQNYPDTEESKAEEKLEAFNRRLESLKDQYKVTSSDIEAYQMALEFETGAEEYYADRYAEAENPHVKRFYRWLIDEETMHSRLIKSCLRFVEDPADWFRRRKNPSESRSG